ncbi:hypothetical protein AUEXF2481DRAFT_82497 [Aureobasidium subglaciale EXF-2481]|uniref:Uncharacterized protein n=1 Tax=Aureobasidium subglaciale (strain EXF-2481) TaxID=1043005 RepID=A0A074YZB5_AURSE|nr:uncharacterized protein AUEXF2481DRAFT_82497 [Aureobasidium subglaciale EXF-2481]KAI5208094.1 hypothetical protein E4T38_03114 [Aureobasidium subglaciale]KAI5226978.1 hypothetical protein E4T40_02888 [Aureobasidium subglaciale]KAI5230203.1 hypothetical protein E4T41_03111 [Aureobasidium subglaciale]KAI5264693.1 hypothetical protein E4T46_02889 [Aureobasidium subglaciale]KEQ92181.1 hypothetical protein AUEXF2481DRAFT_82497 [Aureobasidium subglaciale EXF-2481]
MSEPCSNPLHVSILLSKNSYHSRILKDRITIMSNVTSWIQHLGCLYACWITQFPTMVFLTGLVFAAWALNGFTPFEAHGKFVLSLCTIMVHVWIYQVFFFFIHGLTATCMLCMQVFESVLITYLGWMFWPFLKEARLSPPKVWHPLAKAVWIGLPVT